MSAIIFMQGKLMQRPVKLGGEDGIDVKEVIEIGILVLPKGTVSVLTIIFMALVYTLAIIFLVVVRMCCECTLFRSGACFFSAHFV